MRRYRRAEGEPEPWIEQLVQNYGQNQRAVSLRAHVVGVGDLSDSVRTDESDACMLFLSDGAVFIPAVLTASAWERLQELEERENFAGLENTTVSVRKYQLNFHMDQELTSCQFYLTVDHMISVGRVGGRGHPPSCTTLPSIQQQILKIWRSLMKECSVNSVNSQSAFPLSCLMGVWHNDIIMDMLNEAMDKITTPTRRRLGVATPTLWHRERLRCRGEESFGAQVSRLVVPRDQRELLTAECGTVCQIINCSLLLNPASASPDAAHPSVFPPLYLSSGVCSSSSDTPSGLAPPLADVMENRPVAVEEGERVPPLAVCDRPTERWSPEVWCGSGGGGGGGGEALNPWDMFCPAPDLLGTPSSSPETSIDLVFRESQSLLPTAAPLPTATSTQAQSSNHSAEQSASSMSATPYQRPHPYLHSPARVNEKTTPTDQTQDKQYTLAPPIWVTKGTPKDPPSKQTLQTPAEDPPPTKVHSDGSCFSYTYTSSPQLLSALSHIQVPEQLVQWAAAYLGTPQLVASRTPELREASPWAMPQRSKNQTNVTAKNNNN